MRRQEPTDDNIRWFLATWAKWLSWSSEVGSIFGTSWNSACRAVEHAVEWGLAHRDLSEVTAVGVDEIAWVRGHTYLTLVYDIGGEPKRLPAVADERTEASLRSCLDGPGEPVCPYVKYVCRDLWQPCLKVIADTLGMAVHVLARFHVMQQSVRRRTSFGWTSRRGWFVLAMSHS